MIPKSDSRLEIVVFLVCALYSIVEDEDFFFLDSLGKELFVQGRTVFASLLIHHFLINLETQNPPLCWICGRNLATLRQSSSLRP